MKVCMWCETSWAFGRISAAIKKYSRHDIDIISWKVPLDDFSKYDLLYIPCWFAKQIYLKYGGKTPAVTGVHGVAELFNYTTDTLRPRTTTAKHVESGRISGELKHIFNSQKIVGCVSRELVNLLRPQVDCALAYTPCGVDTEFFLPIQKMPLTVLCPATPDQFRVMPHGYDAKRWFLVREIQRQLPDIEFKFPIKRLKLDEMPAFYRQGNVILCLSQSEGGPLGPIEAGAGGAIPLSTPVGVMPELIVPGLNGGLLIDIVEDAVRILSEWKTKDLTATQYNAQETMKSRHWKKLIEAWDNFFESSL